MEASRKDVCEPEEERRNPSEARRVELHYALSQGERAVFGALAGILTALSLIFLGFWQTLLIAVFAAAGVFLFAVKDKAQWLKHTINTLFPPKNA